LASSLDNLLVLDLTEGRSGAYATMLLSDNGARVIRIDSENSIHIRKSPGFSVWDRGKETIILDYENNLIDRNRLYKLISICDVLIEDFALSSNKQKFINKNILYTINPKLIHASITVYGKNSLLKNEKPLVDLVLARLGVLDRIPTFRNGPSHLIHPLVDVCTGILSAIGIVSSLFSMVKTGNGRKVETSLMSGALMYQPKVKSEGYRFGIDKDDSPKKISSHVSGKSSTETDDNGDFAYPKPPPFGAGPFYSVMECADGNWIQLACVHGEFIDRAAAVMDLIEVIYQPRFGEGRDPKTEKDREELWDIVAGVIKTKNYSEWAGIFEGIDVPYAKVCTVQEAMNNPQAIYNEMILDLEDPILNTVSQMGLPIKLSETPGHIRFPRHISGEDTEKIIDEFNLNDGFDFTDVENQKVVETVMEPPLKGIKVIESTNVIAGPSLGRILGDLGADVIKMEPLHGDISRPAGTLMFLYLNAQKRSISFNTKTESGKKIALDLASSSDILVANLRPGATDRMGLSTEMIRSVNPKIIEAHVTAFGWEGPYSHRAGLDPLSQAWMGLQHAQGGPENGPVFLGEQAPTDYTGGALGVLGAVIALYVRETKGIVQTAKASLLDAGILLSSEEFLKYKGKKIRKYSDVNQYGMSLIHRIYKTKDGWIYLIINSKDQLDSFLNYLNISIKNLDYNDEFENIESSLSNLKLEFEEFFKSNNSSNCVKNLKEFGVNIVEVSLNYNKYFFDDFEVVSDDIVGECYHKDYGDMKYLRNLIRFENTNYNKFKPTPKLGEHTREILANLNYTSKQIDLLFEEGIVHSE
tara:strand:+ start:19136 stop:21571 length:2436 start_codon:yes stop_codon:yes gene_type:complete